MLIAAKFEETWAPEINDFVYMSDKAYTNKDVLAMECRILQAIDFQLGRPLPLHFLRRNTQAASQILQQVSFLRLDLHLQNPLSVFKRRGFTWLSIS